MVSSSFTLTDWAVLSCIIFSDCKYITLIESFTLLSIKYSTNRIQKVHSGEESMMMHGVDLMLISEKHFKSRSFLKIPKYTINVVPINDHPEEPRTGV